MTTTPEPIGPHLHATVAAWTAANQIAEQITEANLPTVLGTLAERWEQEAATAEATIGHFKGPAAATLDAEVSERARIYRQAAADLRDVLRTGLIPHDLMTRTERQQRGATTPPPADSAPS